MVAKLNIVSKNAPVSFWRRVLAYAIDLLIINIILSVPFGRALGKSSNLDLLLNNTINHTLIFVSFIVIFLMLAYFIIMEYLIKQTVGKMFLNIYVVSLGKKLGLQQIILRNITKPFSLVLLVDVVYMILKRKNQRLFEVFSNTMVVEKRLVLR